MAEATLSTKNQIVIPKEARQALGVKAGDKLLLVIRGAKVIVLQRPESHHASILGLAKKPYPERYIEKERQSWE
jgi:AbrB family looped-hinge helix DNA binding protein